MKAISYKKLGNACLGNAFEHYDTALFGFLSPFLAPMIFPKKDPLTALILTYAMIPLGMLARPFGALIFGYIGDVYGRERSLFLTLASMGFISACIACSPTYQQVGPLAPIFFCLGRVLQNFLAAGETMGGAIYILEHTTKKRRDLVSSLYGASTIGGHLLASMGVYLISQSSCIHLGWRFLYLFGFITAVFGCMFRRSSSPSSSSSASLLATYKAVKTALFSNQKALLMIILTSGFACATYSVALVVMNGFIPLVTSLSKAKIMKINTYLLVLDFCALPFFGWIASKISREKLMLFVALGTCLLALPLLGALQGASLAIVLGVRSALVIIGVAFFAPFHAWAQQLVPPQSRYAIISFGYALGSQLLGGPTAALSLWIFQQTGITSSVAWYWMLLAIASSAILLKVRYAKKPFKKEFFPEKHLEGFSHRHLGR